VTDVDVVEIEGEMSCGILAVDPGPKEEIFTIIISRSLPNQKTSFN